MFIKFTHYRGLLMLLVLGTGTFCVLGLPGQINNSDDGELISIIRLIASPDKFDGIRVRVQGVCAHDFNHYSIYASMEAVKNSRFMDGVCLDVEKLDEDQKNKLRDSVHQDIWIEGVYSEKSQAPYGYSSGTFYVERIFNSMKSKK